MKSINYDRNVKTLKALRESGSDPSKKHAIEHHLYCYSESDNEKLRELGKLSGYEIMYEGVVDDKDGQYWQLDLVKSVNPNIETIEIQSKEIERYAEQTNADYDGWGTEVEV